MMEMNNVINYSDILPFDVLCGRDKESYNNIGNRRFRIMININLQKYVECKSRPDRSKMILELTNALCRAPGQFRFLKKVKSNGEDDVLIVLDHKQSREKIAHALRDAAAQQKIMQKKRADDRKADFKLLSNTRQMLSYISAENQPITLSKDDENDKRNSENRILPLPNELSMMILQDETLDVEEILEDSMQMLGDSLHSTSDGRRFHRKNRSSMNVDELMQDSLHSLKVSNHSRMPLPSRLSMNMDELLQDSLHSMKFSNHSRV